MSDEFYDVFLDVRQTCKGAARHSVHVKIDAGAIDRFAARYKPAKTVHWKDGIPFTLPKEADTLMFDMLVHAVGFSFWGTPKWSVRFKGKEYDGFWALIACFARAIESGIPVLDPKYLATLSDADGHALFLGQGEIPLLRERILILREAGSRINGYFYGDINKLSYLLSTANQVLQVILSSFPSFIDASQTPKWHVFFHKRAQLLVDDICERNPNLIGREQLTACADYKVPQALHDLGILSYDEKLSELLRTEQELPRNSQEELDIRACTVQAVEEITSKLRATHPEVTAKKINDALWLEAQKGPHKLPYHRVRTTAY